MLLLVRLVQARSMPQFEVVETEEGTVLHFEQALKAESLALKHAHAEAQQVEVRRVERVGRVGRVDGVGGVDGVDGVD